MNTSRQWMAPLLIGLVALAGCSQFKIRTDYDQTADFPALHTYGWRPAPPDPTGDPRFDNSLINAAVRAAIDRELAAKGYAQAASGTPDFLVGYDGVVKSKIDVATIDRRYGYRGGVAYGHPTLDARTYEEGTLLVDVIDPRTTKLLWRGSATGAVRPESSIEQREQRINQAVADILKEFPPGR